MSIAHEHDGSAAAPGTTLAAPSFAPQLVDRSVVHDLRNPLSAIAGNLQLLQMSLEETLDAKNRTRLEACLSSTDELAGMLTDLHHLVVMHAGELEPSYKQVDLRALTRTVMCSSTIKTAQGGQALSLADGPALCVPAMPQLISRAVHNLIISALRVSKNPPITIQVEKVEDDAVRIVITYAGLLVPPDLAEHLFDAVSPPSQRQHGLRVDRARGLYFVRVAAEIHGGEARYEPLDDGGRFILRLPQHPEPPAPG
jgi:two-component system heavy metal sensor histidine kinase CusS